VSQAAGDLSPPDDNQQGKTPHKQEQQEHTQEQELQGIKESTPGSEKQAQEQQTQQQHPLLSAARQAAGGDRAAGCVWLADDSLLGPIFKRAAPHLPQKLCGNVLAGLNARLRFYRCVYPNKQCGLINGSCQHAAACRQHARFC
jgi:hypothetical protein